MNGGRGKNDDFAVVFLLMETTEFLEHEMGKLMKIWDRGMRPSRVIQEPTIFSNKICSLKAKKVLATIWYENFYRWLTVAPLGDGAFLKASRTSVLHSLGG